MVLFPCAAQCVLAAYFSSVQSLSRDRLLPMDCSTPGFPIHHQLLEPTQTPVHGVGDAIQPSHPLLSPSLPAFYLAQFQGLSQWIGSSYQVVKVLEFQLQHQSIPCCLFILCIEVCLPDPLSLSYPSPYW